MCGRDAHLVRAAAAGVVDGLAVAIDEGGRESAGHAGDEVGQDRRERALVLIATDRSATAPPQAPLPFIAAWSPAP